MRACCFRCEKEASEGERFGFIRTDIMIKDEEGRTAHVDMEYTLCPECSNDLFYKWLYGKNNSIPIITGCPKEE